MYTVRVCNDCNEISKIEEKNYFREKRKREREKTYRGNHFQTHRKVTIQKSRLRHERYAIILKQCIQESLVRQPIIYWHSCVKSWQKLSKILQTIPFPHCFFFPHFHSNVNYEKLVINNIEYLEPCDSTNQIVRKTVSRNASQ